MKPFLPPSLILLAVLAGCAHISQKESHQPMRPNSHEGHFDYVEFPAQSAESFAAAKAFYKEVFGWSFQEWGAEYADTKDSGITCGLSSAPDHRPAGTLAVLFTADLEGTRDRVIRSGGRIAKDIVAFPGGRRFEYIDPAGNRLGVWSDK
jgi:predicted enzyme related to lactoylglutathione lyase